MKKILMGMFFLTSSFFIVGNDLHINYLQLKQDVIQKQIDLKQDVIQKQIDSIEKFQAEGVEKSILAGQVTALIMAPFLIVAKKPQVYFCSMLASMPFAMCALQNVMLHKYIAELQKEKEDLFLERQSKEFPRKYDVSTVDLQKIEQKIKGLVGRDINLNSPMSFNSLYNNLQRGSYVQSSGEYVSLKDQKKLREQRARVLQQDSGLDGQQLQLENRALAETQRLPYLSPAAMKQQMGQVLNYVRNMDMRQLSDHTREFLSKLMEMIRTHMSNLRQAAGRKWSQADEKRLELYNWFYDKLQRKTLISYKRSGKGYERLVVGGKIVFDREYDLPVGHSEYEEIKV